MNRHHTLRLTAVAGLLMCTALTALANPPPPRQRDPISLDQTSPSVIGFGSTWSDLYGDNPVPPGMGFDVGGPGPVMHVFAPAYGILPLPDNTNGISNNEFQPFSQQVIYFSVDTASIGAPGTPVRNQALRGQHAGDRWVLNGRSSVAPAVGPFPAVRIGGIPGPRHLLSANQTAYNEIPSIPPGAFNFFAPPAGATNQDNMDALELNPIDLNGDFIHDTIIYFTLQLGSPTLGLFGGSGANILVAPPGAPVAGVYAPFFTMGLTPADDIDALAVWNTNNNPLIANPGVDFALFSLTRGSPYLNGPDGIAGTADDFSAADIFVTNFTGVSRLFMAAGQLGLLPTDNVDGLDVEPFVTPQVFDWWVQRFNIDFVFRPPPTWPPTLPANDLHVVIPGLEVEQVFDLWTGSFPNVTVEAVPGGVRINWSGANFLPGQVAHIGWTIADTTTLSEQALQIYWTRNGVPIQPNLPDNVQRWFWEGNEVVIDRVPNIGPEPVLVQRRINRSAETVGMADLLRGSSWWESAQVIDPVPLPLMPDSFFDVFFQISLPGMETTRTFSVMYDVFNVQGQRIATHLNAMTMIRTPELEFEGACCFATSCQIASQEFCQTWGGQYRGTGTECEQVVCGPVFCPGDMNCDGVVDFDDIDPFVLALSGPAAYHGQYPNCQWLNADTDGDGDVDFDDIDPFVSRIGSACP
ncbi:MAG: hypothetical protein IPM13_04135 [Phycisphaerales bacterium]|nr:hypothetical protein [Phycisphaerales bacterium]